MKLRLNFNLKPNWNFLLSKWWKILAMGTLIAIGIALFPYARCAVAQNCTSQADLWCNWGQPGWCCGPTNGLKRVITCVDSGSYCAERGAGINAPAVSAHCTPSQGHCRITSVDPYTYNGVTYSWSVSVAGGKSYWDVGYCSKASGTCQRLSRTVEVSCCSGGGSGGGCTPQYARPSIGDTYTVWPPNPIVWGQEKPPFGQGLGMTIGGISVTGGEDTACGTGKANITSIAVRINLTQASRDWITRELARRYYGAHVKGTYPYLSEFVPAGHPLWGCDYNTGLNTPNATANCHFFRPVDPGRYEVIVTACQSDGQCTTKTMTETVAVWLLDTTLSMP